METHLDTSFLFIGGGALRQEVRLFHSMTNGYGRPPATLEPQNGWSRAGADTYLCFVTRLANRF
jgi:hypothetical protein